MKRKQASQFRMTATAARRAREAKATQARDYAAFDRQQLEFFAVLDRGAAAELAYRDGMVVYEGTTFFATGKQGYRFRDNVAGREFECESGSRVWVYADGSITRD